MRDAIARLERELAAARQQAELATRARSAFLAAMSHEIKTPMNAVFGSSRLLLETTLTPQQREHVAVTLAAGEALLTIVDDALDYAALEGGTLTLADAPFDVVEVVDAAIRLDAARADEKGLDLAAIVDPAVPAQVAGDAARVRMIVRKLLANAITFTECGSVLVRVGFAATISSTIPRIASIVSATVKGSTFSGIVMPSRFRMSICTAAWPTPVSLL